MESENLLSKEKAEKIFKDYNYQYGIKIIETKIMLCIADENEEELIFWNKVKQDFNIKYAPPFGTY